MSRAGQLSRALSLLCLFPNHPVYNRPCSRVRSLGCAQGRLVPCRTDLKVAPKLASHTLLGHVGSSGVWRPKTEFLFVSRPRRTDILLASRRERGASGLKVPAFASHQAHFRSPSKYIRMSSARTLSPLMDAAAAGRTGDVKRILDGGADVDDANLHVISSTRLYIKADRHMTPLFEAVSNGHHNTARLLLERKADPFRTSEDGENLLHAVVSRSPTRGHVACAKLLIAHKLSPDQRASGGLTPLHAAIAQHEILSEMLAPRIGINSKNNSGETPIFLASTAGHADSVRLLVSARADVEIPNDRGLEPLMVADNMATARWLLTSMCPIALNPEQTTAYHRRVQPAIQHMRRLGKSNIAEYIQDMPILATAARFLGPKAPARIAAHRDVLGHSRLTEPVLGIVWAFATGDRERNIYKKYNGGPNAWW